MKKLLYTFGFLPVVTLLLSTSLARAEEIRIYITTEIRDVPLAVEVGIKSQQQMTIDTTARTITTDFTTGETVVLGIVELEAIRSRFTVDRVNFSNNNVSFRAMGQTASGVMFMPNINYSFNLSVDLAARTVHVTGCHDGYPSYNIWNPDANSTIYDYQQGLVVYLFGSCDIVVDKQAAL